jgi:hypothetical protein
VRYRLYGNEERSVMATVDMWTYHERVRTGGDLSGYQVEAVDGGIGKIDEATFEEGSSCIVVDTGPWIFGKKVMIPAGAVENVDHEDKKVFVDRTKDDIKNAPEFDESLFHDETYRADLGSYYSRPGQPESDRMGGF